MQITFEVPVVLTARSGRMTSDRTVYGYHPVVLDVPVLDAEDAPVAISYKTRDRNGFVKEEAFRGHEGELYHAVETRPDEAVSLVLRRHMVPDELFEVSFRRIEKADRKLFEAAGSDYIAQAAARMFPRSYSDFHKHRHLEVSLEPIAGMDLKGDFDQSLAEQVESFLRTASRLLIIDGRFYLPEPEPLIRMVTLFGGDVGYEAVRHAARQEPGLLSGRGLNIDVLGYFRFDESDRLHSEIERLADGHAVVERLFDIDVNDTRYLHTDAEALTLVELAAVFRQYFACSLIEEGENFEDASERVARTLSRLPLDQLALYQRLCAGIEAVKAGGDPAELEEAVMTIMDSDLGSMERHLFVYGGNVAKYAEIIADRWNNRPVDTTLAFSRTPR